MSREGAFMGIISGFVKYKALKNGLKVVKNILRKKETTAPRKVRATYKKRATT